MLQSNSKMIKTGADSHRRYVFLNLLRVMACAVVIGYHFFKEAFLLNLTSFPDPDDVLPVGNIHPVMIAVSIFFMISGIGLALKMGKEDKPDWKKFYLGRFKAILVPFYITWILWAVYKLITAGSEAFAGIGAKSILCTLFGADTFAQLYTPVFTLHVGEWFLGALVVLYVFFPVFYTLLKKYFVPALAVAVVAYVIVVMTYSSAIPWHMNIVTRMFCFVFGIAIGMHPELFDDTPKWMWAAPLLVIGGALMIPPCFSDMMVSLGVLSIAILLEKCLCKCSRPGSFLGWAAGISYYIFLTHHVIILEINTRMSGHYFNKKQTLLYFIAEFAITLAAGLLVKWIHSLLLYSNHFVFSRSESDLS